VKHQELAEKASEHKTIKVSIIINSVGNDILL